jgi:hypothetical protein
VAHRWKRRKSVGLSRPGQFPLARLRRNRFLNSPG